MATDLQITAAIQDLNLPSNGMSVAAFAVTQAGANKRSLGDILLVTTSELAIPIPAGTLGWGIFINLDPTNYIELETATSGVFFARITPAAASGLLGAPALFYFGSGVTAPFAKANTGSCRMWYRIWEA